MSSNVTLLLARRSMRARIGRLIAIAIAILVGVAFVVGSFVLADSLRSGFDYAVQRRLREHRLAGAFRAGLRRRHERRRPGRTRPVPAELVDTVAAVDGVADADGMLQRYAQLIDSDGEAVTTQGAPMFGASWDSTDPDNSIRLLEGDAPVGPEQVAIDKATADRDDFEVGDQVDVVTDTGSTFVHALGNRRPRRQRRLRWGDVRPLGPADGGQRARCRRRVRRHRHPCRRR